MGFKSKRSKVRAGNAGGRPSGTFSQLDEKEKRDYNNNAVYKHRYGESRPVNYESSESDSDSDHYESTGVGRPPIGLVAMSPTKLRVRMNFLNKKRRKEKHISETRRNASMSRWNTVDQGETDNINNSMQMEIDSDKENDGDDASKTDDDIRDEEANTSTEEVSSPKDASLSRTTLWRRKCRMRGIMTNPMDNLHVLMSFNKLFQISYDLSTEIRKIHHPSELTERQYMYRAKKMVHIFEMCDEASQCELMVYWLDQLLSHSVVEAIFNQCGAILPAQFVPRALSISRKASDIASQYFSCSSRQSDDIRVNSVKYVVQVAKECGLSSTKHGDGVLLAEAVSCHPEFAEKVLKHIDAGDEEELYKRRTRFDAIKCTIWPALIKSFVFLPENSRSVPGQQQVSVRYGVRLPKYLLLRSRQSIASEFKEKNPECPFKISTIMREFPQNAVTQTSRDIERNTCPTHANVRRLVARINRVIRKKGFRDLTLPTSCRSLATSIMCPSPVVSSLEPTSWIVKCVSNKCTDCPGLQLNLPQELLKESITYSLWASKKVEVTKVDSENNPKTVKKTVFSLYQHTQTVEEAIKKLSELLVGLKWHIYTSHRQWTGHDVHRSNLDSDSLIFIEDYQMNMEVPYRENPTNLAYSTNKKTVALYPICVEYLNEHGQLCKGAIVFLSEDKKHDHQQVEQFEIRAFQIVRELLKRPFKHWKRFSDGCTGQFRSRFVVARMFDMKEELNLTNLSYDLFESHEGKSTSDTIGSIVKCAFLRGMFQQDEGLFNIDDMIRLIKSKLSTSMDKFKFFVVESFGYTVRKKRRNELVIPQMSKMHSLVLNGDSVIPRYWTCLECRVNQVCDDCKKLPSLSREQIITKSDEIESDDSEAEERFNDSEDDGATDQSDSDESDDEVDEDLGPGDIVWALYGRRWYPGRLVHLNDLPENLMSSFKNPKGKSVVKWYGEDRYSLVSKVDQLAENRVDAHRAAQSKDILQAYNLALEDLHNQL